jgi:hypothetical protein
MTYSERVKAAKTIINAVKVLKDKEYIVVTYGTDYNNVPQEYRISCSIYKEGKPSYSIYRNEVWALGGMNIESFTNTLAKAYTYDMMRQRTAYNFPLCEMVLVEEPFKEQVNTSEWGI